MNIYRNETKRRSVFNVSWRMNSSEKSKKDIHFPVKINVKSNTEQFHVRKT